MNKQDSWKLYKTLSRQHDRTENSTAKKTWAVTGLSNMTTNSSACSTQRRKEWSTVAIKLTAKTTSGSKNGLAQIFRQSTSPNKYPSIVPLDHLPTTLLLTLVEKSNSSWCWWIIAAGFMYNCPKKRNNALSFAKMDVRDHPVWSLPFFFCVDCQGTMQYVG